MKKHILIIGSGTSTLQIKPHINELFNKYDTLVWGFAWKILPKNTYPTYYAYLDPHSAIETLDKINQTDRIDTQILIFDGIVNKDIKTLKSYIGSTSLKHYNEYIKKLKASSKKCNHIHVECTTLKKDKDAKDDFTRFESKQLILGTIATKHASNEDKLTMCVLPLLWWLKYTTVYITGFDGNGGRFFQPKNDKGLHTVRHWYNTRLKQWIEWEKYHKMKIYSIMENAYINKTLQYLPLRELL